MSEGGTVPEKRKRGVLPSNGSSAVRSRCQCKYPKACKQKVNCACCGQCDRACRKANTCETLDTSTTHSPLHEGRYRTRLSTGSIDPMDASLHGVPVITPQGVAKQRQLNEDPVTHRALDRTTATATDLAQAFGRPRFYLSTARKRLNALRASMRSRGKNMTNRVEDDDNDTDEEDLDETGTHGDNGEDNSEEDESVEDADTSKRELSSCFNALRVVVDNSAMILAGGRKEADELSMLFFEGESSGWTKTFVEKVRTMLDSTIPSSEANRAVRAVCAQSMTNRSLVHHGLASEKSAFVNLGIIQCVYFSGVLFAFYITVFTLFQMACVENYSQDRLCAI